MNLRVFVILVYVVAFLISVMSIASIPVNAWQYIANSEKASFALSALVGLCGVLRQNFIQPIVRTFMVIFQ